MHKYSLLLLLFLLLAASARAQKISGIVKKENPDGKLEPVFSAHVQVFEGGSMRGGAVTDFNGKYSVGPLSPGVYRLRFSHMGDSLIVRNVRVSPNKTTRQDVTIPVDQNMIQEIEVSDNKLVEPDQTTSGNRITGEDLAKRGSRDPVDALQMSAGVTSQEDGGGLNVKGMSSDKNITYIDGVRQFGNVPLPPPEAIAEVFIATGGISAQYGDALGGVVNVTTKKATKEFYGGVTVETSRPFDGYNYDLVGLNLSGPLMQKKVFGTPGDSSTMQKRTVLDFMANMQFKSYREPSPVFDGFQVIDDGALNSLKNDALRPQSERPSPDGTIRSSADWFNEDDFHRQDYLPNAPFRNLQFNGRVGYQATPNILLAAGGNFQYFQGRSRTQNSDGSARSNAPWTNLFNYDNNSLNRQYSYQIFGRMVHTFPNPEPEEEEESTGIQLKNLYYQLQVDFTQSGNKVMDAQHRDNLSRYNHAGSFKELRQDANFLVNPLFDTLGIHSSPTGPEQQQLSMASNFDTAFVLRNGRQTGLEFERGPWNPELGAVTQEAFTLANSINNDIGSLNDLRQAGGANNGIGLNLNAGYFFGNIGNTIAPYQISQQEQYRATGQVGVDIKEHTLKAGFVYEQRVQAAFNGGTNIWNQAKNRLNNHLLPTNSLTNVSFDTITAANSENRITYIYVDGERVAARDADGNVSGQTTFDKNFRQRFDIPINEEVNLDNMDRYDPDKVTLDLFSPNELFNNGTNRVTNWRGYDAHGNRSRENPDFNDFFLDTTNRPIDAFRPVYMAGYIEDKFSINDLFVRVGVRVDRYDANQPVLKDPYSMTELERVGETDISQFRESPDLPSNIGDDYAIYVNRSAQDFNGQNQGDFEVVGFRSGDTWFDANGTELSSSNPIQQAGGGRANPWFDVSNLSGVEEDLQDQTGITLDAFRDFEPQINVLPRLSFSFPINREGTTLFFAHYDVLTQRPNNNLISPDRYFALSQASGGNQTLPNPNLKPQRKIDYEIGFQSLITENSALKLATFYSEFKNFITTVNVFESYPQGYSTFSNIDFGVSKGFLAEYEFRTLNHFTINTNYTLSFAEQSRSNFGSQLVNVGGGTLRNIVPQNIDQRHSVKLGIDYRFGEDEGPAWEVFGRNIEPFENFGVNLSFNAGSGFPYTAEQGTFGRTTIEGNINSARLPWTNRTQMRVNKVFNFRPKGFNKKMRLNVYVYVTNLFNSRNIINVYPLTGEPDDDGFLTSAQGQQQLDQEFNPESYAFFYNLQIANPYNYSRPRWIKAGASLSF